MSTIRLSGRALRLPRSRRLRILVGILLVGGGALGFLPILGFWMIPLGFMVLSVDLPRVRRMRRRAEVRLLRTLRRRADKDRS